MLRKAEFVWLVCPRGSSDSQRQHQQHHFSHVVPPSAEEKWCVCDGGAGELWVGG